MTSSRNLWPLGIVMAFVLFISGTVVLIVVACTHQEELVSPAYYEQEIKYGSQMDCLERARNLGPRAAVSFDPASQRINVCLPASHVQGGLRGTIQLYRPSASGLDQRLRLEPGDDGRQSIDAASLHPGPWRVRVSWTFQGSEYLLEQKVVVGPA